MLKTEWQRVIGTNLKGVRERWGQIELLFDHGRIVTIEKDRSPDASSDGVVSELFELPEIHDGTWITDIS